MIMRCYPLFVKQGNNMFEPREFRYDKPNTNKIVKVIMVYILLIEKVKRTKDIYYQSHSTTKLDHWNILKIYKTII